MLDILACLHSLYGGGIGAAPGFSCLPGMFISRPVVRGELDGPRMPAKLTSFCPSIDLIRIIKARTIKTVETPFFKI